jgi:hypothetical protein
MDSAAPGYDPVAGCYEHGNGLSGSIKGGKFLVQLSDYQLLKKGTASSFCVHKLNLN